MISVIIPTYKRPTQIKRAILSVLNQSYKDFEILVIDDDQENEFNIEQEVALIGDQRVLYLKNGRTKGGNGARNTGIVNAKGKYIAFLDDDDIWLKDKLLLQFERMQTLDETWAGCYCGWKVEQNTFLNGKEGDLFEAFLTHQHRFGASSTLFIRRSVFDKVGLWDEDLIRYQDYELMARIYKEYLFAHVNKVLVDVDGHNIPNLNKIKQASTKFVKKIEKLTEDNLTLQGYFKSQLYRSQAVLYALNGEADEMLKLILGSLKVKMLSPKKYIACFIYLLNYYTFKKPFGTHKKYMAEIFARTASSKS